MSDGGNNHGRGKLQKAVRQRRERRETWGRAGERSLWQNLSMYGALGWLVVVPTLLGVVVGRWLDARFGSGVTFTGAAILLGAAFGLWLVWRRMNDE